jgi:hypothetical protein
MDLWELWISTCWTWKAFSSLQTDFCWQPLSHCLLLHLYFQINGTGLTVIDLYDACLQLYFLVLKNNFGENIFDYSMTLWLSCQTCQTPNSDVHVTYICFFTHEKGKVVPLHSIEVHLSERRYSSLFLNLGTRRGWVVSITLRPPFTPRERAPGTHCIGGWVGPRAGLDAEIRGKILCLCRGSNPGCPVCSQTLYWLSYPSSCFFTHSAVNRL